MEEQAREDVTRARQFIRNRNYSKAFDLYILAFEKNPGLKIFYEVEFHNVLIKLNAVLAAAGKIQEIFDNFGKAMKAYPENISLLNEIGQYLYKYGYYSEAWSHFQKALTADPGFVKPEKNLNSIKNLLVERWHFRMLNDKVRNELYRTAIRESITPIKDSVVDVGTGTGLLALFAHECKPAVITACDASAVMAEMAELIFQDMGINDIAILNKMSTSITHKEMGGKRSLLITEMFDAGLFGEHALTTIAHAWEHLLNSSARVVPSKAEFFICAVSSNDLHLRYQLGLNAKTLLKITEYVLILANNETYDCEDLNFFNDLKYITNPESLLKVDFNSYDDLLDKLQRCEPYTIELKAVENGEANMMVGWFNLQLTENVLLTTDPRSPMRCNAWQQAVFFDFIPKTVKINDTITSHFLTNGGKLTMLTESKRYIQRASPETVRFLNDSEYMKMIMGCIGMACVYLGQILEMSEIIIVDLCPFPMFGIQMLKRGAKTLICYAKTYSDEELILTAMTAYNLEMSSLIILNGSQWTPECFRDDKYHVIFCNTFELCGEIDMKFKEIAKKLKNLHLYPGGLFMPFKITLMGQLVECSWLNINNKVYDENVCDYKISKYMNKYQVSQHLSINIARLKYVPLTEATCLGIYSPELGPEVLNIPVINDGSANAILCWYKIEVMEDLGEVSTNRSDSFIDNMAFLADPSVNMKKGDVANVLRCVDPDGAFKLVIDVEAPA